MLSDFPALDLVDDACSVVHLLLFELLPGIFLCFQCLPYQYHTGYQDFNHEFPMNICVSVCVHKA